MDGDKKNSFFRLKLRWNTIYFLSLKSFTIFIVKRLGIDLSSIKQLFFKTKEKLFVKLTAVNPIEN